MAKDNLESSEKADPIFCLYQSNYDGIKALKMSSTPQYLFEEIPPEAIFLTISDMRGLTIQLFQELFAFQVPTSKTSFTNGICSIMR